MTFPLSFVGLSLAIALMAMTLPGAAAQPVDTQPMTETELQGVSCIIGGTIGAIGALGYSGTIAAAADAALVILVLPVMAGGYAIGCNVGSATGPGAYWMYRRFFGE